MPVTPRYLVSFTPRRLPHFFADVLIIGGGLAGLRAANAIDPRLSVLVVTKDALLQSNSNYAQGGIAGVMDPIDRFEDHVSDTLIAGGSLCDKRVVDMVVREAPERIAELVEWGTKFDEKAGRILLGREGGHSHNRIVHALGDMTGREVMRAMAEHTIALPNVRIWENTFTIDLLTYENSCQGAIVANRHGDQMLVWAKQTVLTTGGAGQVYRETTNPSVATGDGHSMAYRAGAELRDMEFMQFHPTVLYIAGGSRSLITEAIRGEGAKLVDRDGVRFMSQYDPRLELAPRDIVSQAIVTQMEKTRHPCVYLDVTHLDRQFTLERFPGIAAACKQFGLDITRDRIPVRPGAHYMIGGVTVDLAGRTTISGLWAAGEATSSGLHGANRLASNSLLEGLVYGAHAGHGASQSALAMPGDFRVFPIESPPLADSIESQEPLDVTDIRNSLKALMWRACGVRRTAELLQEALEAVDQWRRYVLLRQFNDVAGWELQNLLCLARVMIQAALAREESRGTHLRTDFPKLDDAYWNRHIWFQHSGTAESTGVT
ncbi:L-aspartate oxidase [Anatilimnocola aggregata]|uniref:L-aspartate oxidase n=1 Tax=Anatilimnocola aggregata TaxID=2528021 RepID=A0A517YES7_9BACT|nr:L-aspartate oxidase [Anatilimnocola aggregata]QDU28718.1 L-aspartate oxidase [Anatilimnocola aggregata]